MSEFEYFSAVIAVILGLGVTHILAQVSFIAQHPGRVRLHWIPFVWLLVVFVAHFSAWWNIWELRDSLRFSFRIFLYMLIGPIALYLAARTVIPTCTERGNFDLESHYFAVNRLFFPMIAAFIVWPAVLGVALPDRVSWSGILGHAILLVPAVACAATRNRRVHQAGTVVVGLLFASAALAVPG